MIVLDESAVNAVEFGFTILVAWAIILTAVGLTLWLAPFVIRWYDRMIDDNHTD